MVGLEEIFLDIEYNVEGTLDLRLGWLKFDRCYYNWIIKKNLDTHLYENEESYSVDIIDWIVYEVIDINQQQQMYGNIYGTNSNILRIMSGMIGGLNIPIDKKMFSLMIKLVSNIHHIHMFQNFHHHNLHDNNNVWD